MRILYATDGSQGALAAGEFLRGLSFRRDSHIHIVTVMDTPNRETLLQTARARLDGLPVSITIESLSGSSTTVVIEAILLAGDTMAADFILLGASGRSAIAQFFVGSVAAGVAHQACRSVLVVRTDTGTGLKSAIVGVDSSARTRDAVIWAMGTFPLPAACALRLVAVVPSQTWATFSVPSETDPFDPNLSHEIIRVQTLEEERQRAESQVGALAREAQSRTGAGETARQVTTEVRQGNRVDELIQAAKAAGAGLIIVGTKERTATDRFLISSISERVLRHAPCSVLIVRMPGCREVPARAMTG